MSRRRPSSAGPSSAEVLLVSCYELGRQPFNIASPWAQLEASGFRVRGVDTAIDALDDGALEGASLVAVSVPMHTALRLGLEVARRVRRRAPAAHVCFYGLYAALNAEQLLASDVDSVIGGEFEVALVALASALAEHGGELPHDLTVEGVTRRAGGLTGKSGLGGAIAPPVLRKLPFVVPRRDGLPPPSRYATFFGPTPGEKRAVGYVEATRGCLHRCRHCPVTPVYQGRLFVVPSEVVLADAAQQIARGARHITFGDPDFLNGPGHTMAIARALAEAHTGVSFDVTAKIDHLLRHADLLPELAALGCAFVVSAVESLSDEVLARLDKGHDKRDVFRALDVCRRAGIALRPSLVAFTPWTTLDDYIEVVDWIMVEGLVDHLDPIQLAIRLLVPPGSALLEGSLVAGAEPPAWLGARSAGELGYSWEHPDARMDRLYDEVSAIVERGVADDPAAVVASVRAAAHAAAGREPPPLAPPPRRFVPRLSEAWFCCAEPNARQFEKLKS
jgi:hypothetical protein